MLETRSYLLAWLAIFGLSIMCACSGFWILGATGNPLAVFSAVVGSGLGSHACWELIKCFRARRVGRIIKKLAKEREVEMPDWCVLPESWNPLRGRFGFSSDGKHHMIEFFGIPNRHVIEDEFEHYLDWRRSKPAVPRRHCMRCRKLFGVERPTKELREAARKLLLCPDCRDEAEFDITTEVEP